jgi:hypothetical protein
MAKQRVADGKDAQNRREGIRTGFRVNRRDDWLFYQGKT